MREFRKEANCHSGKCPLLFTKQSNIHCYVNLTLALHLTLVISLSVLHKCSGIKYKSVFNCTIKTFNIHKVIASIQYHYIF